MKAPKNVKSDNEFFRIAFKSNDKFDGTGFEAFYQFRSHEGQNEYLFYKFLSNISNNYFLVFRGK